MSAANAVDRAVLVVDDDEAIRDYLRRALSRDGYAVTLAEDLAAARAAVAEVTFDVAMIDQELPDGNGLDLLQQLTEAEQLDTRAVVITGYGELSSALRAMRLGATDYVEKPFSDLAALRDCLQRSIAAHDAQRDRRRLLAQLQEKNLALEALAARDPLTRLFNRAHLRETLERELQRSERNGLDCSLLLVDLDELRSVNLASGQAAGDRLLVAIAELLEGRAPALPPELRRRAQDLAARYKGGTFALLLPETQKGSASAIAERLRETIQTTDLSSYELPRQTVSIGVTSYPRDARTVAHLVERAELALYAAKRAGRNRMVGYTTALDSLSGRNGAVQVDGEIARLDALDRSIAGREFNFVYQPIVRAQDGTPFAYEALCRPRDAQFPNPGVLIETAERAGRVAPLGRALRESSIRALDRLPFGSTLFINVHPIELFDPEFIAIESFMAEWTDQVVFEITEVANIKDYARVREIMARLRGSGFKIALDDLGAGYSGLNSLALLRPDYVKLDMQLVRGVGDSRTARLIKHIIEFASDEHMMVVAEGIETDAERRALVGLGCPLLQGYFFSKGLPLNELLAKLMPPAAGVMLDPN